MGEASSFCGYALPLSPPPLFLIYSVLPVIGADGFIEIFTLLEVGLALWICFSLAPRFAPLCPSLPHTNMLPSSASFLFTQSLAHSLSYIFFFFLFNDIYQHERFERISPIEGSTKKLNIKNLHQYFVEGGEQLNRSNRLIFSIEYMYRSFVKDCNVPVDVTGLFSMKLADVLWIPWKCGKSYHSCHILSCTGWCSFTRDDPDIFFM